MSKQAERDALAAMLAKSAVQITKLPAATAALEFTAKDWREQVRKPASERGYSEDRLINERHFVIGSNGVEHCRNGLGEWLY